MLRKIGVALSNSIKLDEQSVYCDVPKYSFRCESELDTERFGSELALHLEPGTVLALTGDLGSGKTTLTKAIARGLGVAENVTSPTFNIIKEYNSGRIPLYHFDVYRLAESPLIDVCDQLVDIGAEDYLYGNGVSVIEWANLCTELLPENTIWIDIAEEDDGCRYLHLRQRENTDQLL